MQDRFTVADVRDARTGGTDTNAKVSANFRGKVTKNGVDFLKYGAAYFPYVTTAIPFRAADANVTLTSYKLATVAADGTVAEAAVANAAGKKLNDAALDLANKETAVYQSVKGFLLQSSVTLPPSGGVAGIYAQTDRPRGVWKAPANAGMALVTGTAVPITNDLQDGLNIDPGTGKSVNAIRAFFGKGTLGWGGRTRAGNDNEWRYVNVRRFANFVEESVGKAIAAFVFEPNSANTWVKVRTMIENFLTLQWRDGALMGAKPEQAFNVAVGLGQTMSAQDVLEGYMIVEVHMAIVRPAEFVVLRFMQKMPQA
jgi:phage tail sheath protein FI